MKKYLSLLLMALAFSSAGAESFISDGIHYQTLPDDEDCCEVTWAAGMSYGGVVSIPSVVSYDGRDFTVAGIGAYAFASSEGLTDIELPPTIAYLGRNAFQSCSGLKEITLPEKTAEIGAQAFYGCASLISFSGKGVASVGDAAFSNCTSLAEAELGENLKSLGESSFRGCRSLESFRLPEGIALGEGVFSGCVSLREIALPASLYDIPAYTFSECIGLQQVEGSACATTIGAYAFSTCSALRSFEFSHEISAIGEGAFFFCSDLDMVSIGGVEATIGKYAFSGCSSLQQVEINGVVEIGEEAFANDSELHSISLGESIHYIRERSFRGCTALAKVGCYSDQPPFLANTSFEEETYRKAELEVPYGCGLLYRQTPPWSYFMNVGELLPPGPASVEGLSSECEISCLAGSLVLDGAAGMVEVWSVSGDSVYRRHKEVGRLEIPMPAKGMFIVRYKQKTLKILSE